MTHSSLFPVASTLLEGGAVAFAVWQLWSIRPNKKAEATKDKAKSKDPGHPEG